MYDQITQYAMLMSTKLTEPIVPKFQTEVQLVCLWIII